MASRMIEVDTSVLNSDITEIETEIRNLYSGAAQLESILHQLESMWDGRAKQEFSNAVNDDLRRLRELTKAIETFTKNTDEVRREYERCEGAVSQIIGSIRV